ncbi:MAG: bacteriorhodopsin [Rubrobacteraceae bacterium]
MEIALLQLDELQTATSNFFLWFTTGGMTLATVLFLYWSTSGQPQNYHHYVTSAAITLWAAMMYIVMATGSGAAIITEPDGEARIFYFARYIDWTVTTPLLLLGLAWVALGSISRNPQVVLGLVVADVAMILTGVLSGAWAGPFKWFWFVISCIFFVAVLFLIWGPLASAARSGASPEASLFFPLAVMLTVLWFIYPVVFFFGTEGLDLISIGFEVFLYAVLDILAKVGFGIILLGGIRRIVEQGARA